MMTPPATLSAAIDHLATVPAATRLRFHTAKGEVGPGCHVTELKLADVHSIDCGGRQSRFREARMQILDGAAGSGLTAGKMQAILVRSIRTIDGLGAAPLVIEFGHGNRAMAEYVFGDADLTDGTLRVELADRSAQCKPMTERFGGSCCG